MKVDQQSKSSKDTPKEEEKKSLYLIKQSKSNEELKDFNKAKNWIKGDNGPSKQTLRQEI